jgi:hypothetical protein
MNRKVFVSTPTYVAKADDFSYLWEEVDRRSAGIRLYNAHVRYTDGREEILHTLDILLNPDSGIYWGYREVRQNARQGAEAG